LKLGEEKLEQEREKNKISVVQLLERSLNLNEQAKEYINR
jgi:hypothetical protein